MVCILILKSLKRLCILRILQVTMPRAKFGRIKIRINLLQWFDNSLGHFNDKFCHKVNKTIYKFSQQIANCCSILLATLSGPLNWAHFSFIYYVSSLHKARKVSPNQLNILYIEPWFFKKIDSLENIDDIFWNTIAQ